MNVCIIGLGLIGGSIAIDLKNNKFAKRIIGVDNNQLHCKQALDLGLVDEISSLQNAIVSSQLIILAIPVNAIMDLLPKVLDIVDDSTFVTDGGSTKHSIIKAVANHPNRKQYVAAHPMAGTEFSGPQAAIPQLFNNKINIVCNKEESSLQALEKVLKMYNSLGMKTKYMPAIQHDLHAAYVSHISHISSFILAETVLDKENDEQAIFDMAAGGFESTVRLAKSSPQMWAPIFTQNADFCIEVIDKYIENMTNFRNEILNKNVNSLVETMKKANNIKRILK